MSLFDVLRQIGSVPTDPSWSLGARPARELDLKEGKTRVAEDRSHGLLMGLSTKRKVGIPQELVDHNTLTSPMPWSLSLDRAAQEGLLEFRALVRVPHAESPTELQWQELRIKGSSDYSSFQALCLTAQENELKDIPEKEHNEHWRSFNLNLALSVRLDTQPDRPDFPFRISVVCVLDGKEQDATELKELIGTALWSLDGKQESHKTLRKRAVLQRIVPLAAYCPPIGSLIRLFVEDPFEPQLELTLDDTVRFLAEWAPALREKGIEVLVPSSLDPKRKKRRLTVQQKIQQDSSGLFTWDKLVAFKAQAMLGDSALTADEIDDLVASKRRLIQLQGEWHFFEAEEADRAIEKLREQTCGSVSVAEWFLNFIRDGELDDDLQDNAANDERGRKRFQNAIKELLGLESYEEPEIPQPEGVLKDLWEHQKRGLSWLVFRSKLGLGACLADDMGLGKTFQTLAWILHNRESGSRFPALLVCPVSVLPEWKLAAKETFTKSLKVYVHHGSNKDKIETPAYFREIAKDYDLVLTTYSLLDSDADFLTGFPWSAVILDEAQNIKNPDAKVTVAAKRIQGDFRLALTGTPVENGVVDLWSIFDFLNPELNRGLLGDLARFRQEFHKPIQAGGGKLQRQKLRQLTAPFILRRYLKDVFPNLEKQERRSICALTDEQAALYQAHCDDAKRKLAEEVDKGKHYAIRLTTLTKLKQICNHPALYEGQSQSLRAGNGELRSGKFIRLRDILEVVIANGDRALIFTQYVNKMTDLLWDFLSDEFRVEPLVFDGSLSLDEKEKVKARFKDDAQYRFPFLIVSLRAGGAGLNLPEANHVIHFDRWWNPAVEDQATARAHRPGQTKTVFDHKLICAGTLEDRIDKLLERKKETASDIIANGETSLANLPTDEFLDLVRFDRDAATC